MLEGILATEEPLTWPLQFWPVIPVALIVSIIATLLCEKIAIRFGVVDKPDNNVKTHKKPTPYLGGIAIFVGLIAGISAGICCLPEQNAYDGLRTARWLLGILAAGAVACIVGCIDDIFDIKPWQKVIGQVAAGLILVAAGVTPAINHLGQPFGMLIDTAIVIVFVLGATNSLNLLDGLDGLCAGVTAIMAGAMLFLATLTRTAQNGLPGDSVTAVACLALLASVCGFLPFNYPWRAGARIFMGDAGSLLLGLNMAVLMIMFSREGFQWLAASVVIFGLPILDTAVAFARRLINKRPLFVSDRGHIYDQMMDRGLSLRKTVALCYGLAALYAVIGLVVSRLSLSAAFALCAATVLVSAFAIWKKGYLKMTGLRGSVPGNSLPKSSP